MWRKLWRWLKQIYQSLQQRFQKPEPPPPPRQIPDIECETKFMHLLEAVANGASGGEIQALRMTTNIKETEWIPWLQRFGEQLQQNPETHAEIAQRLVQFGQLHRGELGTVAERIGRQILAQIPPAVVEEEEKEEEKDEGQEKDEAEEWYLRGKEQLHRGHFTTAIASLNEAIRLKPDFPNAYHNRGVAQGNLRQYEDAIASFNEAIRLQPDDPVAYHNRGGAQGNLRQYEDAIASFNEAIRLKPDDPESYLNRGITQGNLGQYKDAIASYNEAIRLKPDFPDAYLNRGITQGNLGQHEDAIASCNEVIRLKPDDPDAYHNRGVAQNNLGQYEDAIVSYNEAIRLKPDDPVAYHNRGVAQNNLGQYEDAIVSYNEAIRLKPDDPDAYNRRGVAQNNLGQYEDAIVSYNEAIRLKPDDPDAYNRRGLAQGNLGQYEDAIVSYNEAIRLKPDDPKAYNRRGLAQGNLGQYPDAIASCNEAIRLKPDYPDAYYGRGVAQGNLGQYKDAIASFNEAIRLKPDYPDAYYGRGVAQGNLGQYEDAIASYNQAISFKLDYPDAYFKRGIVLCDYLGQYEEAIASFNEVIRLKPDFSQAYANRGVAQRNLGQYEDVIASFNEAIRLQSDFSDYYYKRGIAQHNLGQYEEAIASYDFTLTLKRDDWEYWANRANAAGMVQTRNSPYLPSALAIQNPDLNLRGFEGAMASYQEGLKYCPKETHPEGWGMLHFEIGNAYYNRSRKNPKTRHQDSQTARTHYNLALETLTETAYPDSHLKVLRRLIRVLLGSKQTEQAQELKRRGTDVLRRLVEQCRSPGKQRQLALKFADFNQLTVDLWVQQKDVVQALEVAEAGKNACLSWLLDGRGDAVAEPSWQRIRQLLQGQTAVVYWHLSPYALTTFILKPDEDEPQVLRQSQFQDQSGYLGNLLDLESWIEEWNQAYSRDKGSKTSAQSTSWRESLPQQLDRLAEILQISAILEELEGCQGYHRLILIPHKDLHRLPLHALFFNSDGFPQSCAITYLPSAAFGLSRLDGNLSNFIGSIGEEEPLQPDGVGMGTNEEPPQPPLAKGGQILPVGTNEEPPQPPLAKGGLLSIGEEEPPQPPLAKGGLFSSLFSIENPQSKDKDGSHKPLAALPAADIESEIICRMFRDTTRLGESDATQSAVIAALQQSHAVMHFTGHGYYEFADPLASALFLSEGDTLQVKDIIHLNLHPYHLIYLSACETAVTGNPTITSEYVGLTSAFLRSGVGSVLSTLWQVQSDASTLFALYFYQQLQQGNSHSVAFTHTQNWLKTVTKEELFQWYQQQIDELEQKPELSDGDIRCLNYFEACRDGLATIKENPPFAHPYHGSPFTLYGL